MSPYSPPFLTRGESYTHKTVQGSLIDGVIGGAWNDPGEADEKAIKVQKAIKYVILAISARSTSAPDRSSRRSLYTRKKSLSGR